MIQSGTTRRTLGLGAAMTLAAGLAQAAPDAASYPALMHK